MEKKGKFSKEIAKEMGARPLGVPTFEDRIIQEMLRCILEAIYEPEFERINLNYGFRPGKSTHDAITKLESKAKSMDFAIEGDIEGAYDNMNHQILMDILNKKIADKKLLRLINLGLNCGTFFAGKTEYSKIGVTQGSIVSPLLFNIYMHEFDKFITEQVIEKEKELNTIEGRKEIAINPTYNYMSKLKSLVGLPKIKENLKETYKNLGKESTKFIKIYNEFVEKKNKYIELDRNQRKHTSINLKKQFRRTVYVRYADDWILLTNNTQSYVETIKEKISKYLLETLKLKLSKTKTVITKLSGKEPARFLGFQLRKAKASESAKFVGYYFNKQKSFVLRRKKEKIKITDPTIKKYRMRSINPSLIIAWDRKRLLTRLEQKRFIRRSKDEKKWVGCRKTEWTVLKANEIIERYNWVIRGIVNYYGPMTTYATDIFQIYYLLKYSCYHTLANKFNCRISQIIKKYGKDIVYKWKEKIIIKDQITEKGKVIKLVTWKELKDIINEGIKRKKDKKTNPIPHLDEVLSFKINFRTVHKLSSHCCICGSTEKI
jgi:hypothetical protein